MVLRSLVLVLACLLSLSAMLVPTSAKANRQLISDAALETQFCQRCTPSPNTTAPPPEGQIEGPCGLAISPAGNVYVADYYHRTVDVFERPSIIQAGKYMGQIALPGINPLLGINTLDAACGLAFDAAGDLYANEWHQGVVRLTGGETAIDTGESTGVAIDPSTDRLYVDDRTYIAEYELPFTAGAKPLAKIGLGHLDEGYGLAAAGGRVYVADAAGDAVKVFEPTVGPAPVATLSGEFQSLTDAALAIDPTNGHLLVVDNREPGFEHPRSAVMEFASSTENFAYLGELPGAPIDGGPSGIAVTPEGEAIVTDGNSELANAFLYGPYESIGPSVAGGVEGSAAPLGPASSVDRAPVPGNGRSPARRSAGAAISEVSQSGGVRVSFSGSLKPRSLPRKGSRPVSASVGAKIIPVSGHTQPQLRRIKIAINRNGRFAPQRLPVCRVPQIQPATTAAALAACRQSLVGEGTFSAKVLLPQQAPFPSTGKVYAFNGRWHGRAAVLAHVYGTQPLPVSYTIPFELVPQRGTYGTLLRASLPQVTGNSGYITGLSLTFGQRSRARGYVTAGCPAPPGFNIATFPFARVDFDFAGGRRVGSSLVRSCKAG
jgi:DNA-binding beta-propeller fold protein YncE